MAADLLGKNIEGCKKLPVPELCIERVATARRDQVSWGSIIECWATFCARNLGVKFYVEIVVSVSTT